MSNLSSRNIDIQEYSRAYFKNLAKVLNSISLSSIEEFVKVILQAREQGARIYFIGNGGSAATASHFANDIAIGTREREKPFRAISLCDNNAIITAVGNDHGFEEIFSRQLEVLLHKGDVVVAISASGNSVNLLKAFDIAKQKNAITVGISAFDGGEMKSKADVSVHVPTGQGCYGPAEDAHMILDHLISNYLVSSLKG